MQLYKLFYKQFGIRRLQSLLNPELFTLDQLPRDSLLHYPIEDSEAIDVSKLYLRGYSKRILVDFKETLTGQKGAPKHKPIVLKNYIREWLFEHRQFKWQPDHYKVNSDPYTLLVNHYGYLNTLYRYIDLPMTPYNKWWNLYDTIWSSVATIAQESQRQQFIFLSIPDELPSYSLLKLFSTRTTVAMTKVFDSYSKLNLLELWKWVNIDTRELSLLSKIDTRCLPLINIVFTNNEQQSLIINLGYLNSWIKDQPNVTEFGSVIQIHSEQLQKILLKTWMNSQGTTEEEIIEDTSEPRADPDDLTENQMMEEEIEEFSEERDFNEEEDFSGDDVLKASAVKLPISEFKESEDDIGSLDDQLKDIDKDLKILDIVNNRKLSNKGIQVNSKGEVTETEVTDVKSAVNHYVTPREASNVALDILNEEVQVGSITASEYKTLVKDLNSYQSMKDPYGSGQSIADVIIIPDSLLAIDVTKTALKDEVTVLDKGMLSCALQSFDVDYIKNVLHRDVVSMVSGIQKAGVIIKRHEVELEHSALGTYENHTLELKPIKGVSSIIRFKLPKIEEDSTFVSASNKYTLRKQRVDLPIRKINPTTVALTSYYGKSFVSRGDKKANSSLEWLLKQINLSTFDDEGYISKVAPANVFNNTIKTPYIYGALSNYYKSLKAGNYFLMFDYTARQSLLDQYNPLLDLNSIENDNYILIGFTDRKQPIVVDFNNQFYYVDNGYIAIGDIYTILNLESKAAPIDFSEIKIFSKAIPVGILLGYYLGFEGLLDYLKAPYHVSDTKPKVLEGHEYTITFKDKHYILSRKNPLISLIIGGFTVFNKQLKQYTVNDLNHKDVYFNLFREKGLTNIYIKEADLLQQLFIDPITESILKDMGEPTTYIPLIIRATELLLQYQHPDSQDMSEMRIRGYERLSGMVYKELVTSIRQFNNRNILGRSKIEMSPYKVWQTIMTDNTKKMVEDINPIQNLKELEIVTYVGEGGRDKDAMNKQSRAFHPNDMGVISEATVDSSDVGVNTYLSPNPNFKNLRGIISKDKVINTTSLLSTSANLAVSAINDD